MFATSSGRFWWLLSAVVEAITLAVAEDFTAVVVPLAEAGASRKF